jgi:hypothetical protein
MFPFCAQKEHAISRPGEHINPRNDDAKVQQKKDIR